MASSIFASSISKGEREMKQGLENKVRRLTRGAIVPALAAAIAVGVGAYQLAKPAAAASPLPKPAAAALDDASIQPLLSYDHAMEELAARVTPAIVNVTVTAKAKADDENSE